MMEKDEKLELQKLRAFAEKVKCYIDEHDDDSTILSVDNTFTGANNFTGGLQKNAEEVVTMSNVIQVGDSATSSLSQNGLLFVPAYLEASPETSAPEQDNLHVKLTSTVCLDNN